MTDSVMDLEFNLHRGLKVGGFFLKVLVFRIVESLTCQTVRKILRRPTCRSTLAHHAAAR